MVHGIVDKIRSRGGRFLKKDSKTNQWFELSEQQSKEKVGHAVRDAASSYEAKEKRRGSLGASSERAKAKTKAIGRTLSDSEISSYGALEYRQRPLPTLSSVAEVPLVASLPAAGMGLDLSQQQEQHHRFQYDYPLQQLRNDPHPGLLPHPGHHLDHHQVLPHGINPLPVSSLEHSEQPPLHLQPGMPSSAPQQLYSQPPVREGPVEEHAALGIMQHGHHYHQQQPPYAPPGQEEKEPGHHDEHFLEQINDVLGPLPPGAEDPMSPYFRYRRRPR